MKPWLLPEKLYATEAVPPVPSQVPSRHLPRVSHQWHLSGNDNHDNDEIWNCLQIFWNLPYWYLILISIYLFIFFFIWKLLPWPAIELVFLALRVIDKYSSSQSVYGWSVVSSTITLLLAMLCCTHPMNWLICSMTNFTFIMNLYYGKRK